MHNDQKIDEILSVVRSEQQLNNQRYAELTSNMQEERQLNNQRYAELRNDLKNFKVEMSELRTDMIGFKVEIKDEINRVYTALSEDIQAIAGDIDKVKKRTDKLERKIA